jgi:hypothetical protein
MTISSLFGILTGKWTGTGSGRYPTIEPFEYQESLHFTPDETRPIIHYEQKTRRRSAEQAEFIPSHWETGFIELLPDNRIEVANAQSGGRVEVLVGTIEPAPTGLILRLRSSHIANDPRLLKTTRTITVEGGVLSYVMHMQTTAVPQLALHLEGTLSRQS